MNAHSHIPDHLTSLPRSWGEAKATGAKLYCTGKSCSKCGNIDARRYPGGECRFCLNAKNRIRSAAATDRRKAERKAARAAKAAEDAAERQKLIDTLGLDVVLGYEQAQSLAGERDRKMREKQKDRERRLERMANVGTEVVLQENRDYSKKQYWADPDKARARINERHRSGRSGYRMIRLRTPPWLRGEEREWLVVFEKETHERGLEMDHIVPVDDHPLIAGLHVPWNLQALTTAQNNQRRRGCINEFRCTAAEAEDYVVQGMAVWKKDIAEDGTIDWERYPRPKDR